jgi:hypothetical protein
MKEDNNTTNFGIGIIAGLVIGVALGLLYAPQSGEKTREEITGFLDKFLFRLQWLIWTPKRRYLHLWNRTRGT